MAKYSIGTRIEIIRDEINSDFNGKQGIITEYDGQETFPYTVEIDGYGERMFKSTEIKQVVAPGPVVGYELLKDTPEEKAGGVYKFCDETPTYYGGYYLNGIATTPSTYFTEAAVRKTDWFKPVYAPKDITVAISGNRSVVITPDLVEIKGVGNITHADVSKLYRMVMPTTTTPKRVAGFEVSVEVASINIGCQKVSPEDVNNVYQAIQTLKK